MNEGTDHFSSVCLTKASSKNVKQTWTALFFESLIAKRKMHHNRARWILGVGEHVEFFHAVLFVLFFGVYRRELYVVISGPFLCQQKFLKLQQMFFRFTVHEQLSLGCRNRENKLSA